jgi:hypothetical protein
MLGFKLNFLAGLQLDYIAYDDEQKMIWKEATVEISGHLTRGTDEHQRKT